MIENFSQMFFGGLWRAMLYFMIAAGFSLIFGLEEIVNFAHGSIFMVGGFASVEIFRFVGVQSMLALPAGMIVGVALAAIIGTFLEVGLLRKKFGEELNIILITIGAMYIIHYIVQAQYGTGDLNPQVLRPAFLEGPVEIFGFVLTYKYFVFVILLGFVVAGGLKYMLDNTNLGLIIRAGIDDADMTSALGANTKRTFTIVFAIGCALAGLTGSVMMGVTSVNVNLGLNYLFFAFAIVVIGGRGSFKGTFVASLVAGFVYSAVQVYSPYPVQEASLFVLMAIVLIGKPEGIGEMI